MVFADLVSPISVFADLAFDFDVSALMLFGFAYPWVWKVLRFSKLWHFECRKIDFTTRKRTDDFYENI